MLSEKWNEQAKRDAYARNLMAMGAAVGGSFGSGPHPDPSARRADSQAQVMAPHQRVVAMIQARMDSTRLPGKVLRPIHGRPVIGRIFDRLTYCKSLDSILVATSVNPENDPIEAYCTREGIGCFRGDEQDLVARLSEAAAASSADAIVRITADCPLVDPGIVDACVSMWRGADFSLPQLPYDYVSNVWPERFYPDGLDVEVISTECLRLLGPDREALTTNIWKNPNQYRIGTIPNHTENLGHLRWTLDRPDDWPFILKAWGTLPESFAWQEALELYDQHWFRDGHPKATWAQHD